MVFLEHNTRVALTAVTVVEATALLLHWAAICTVQDLLWISKPAGSGGGVLSQYLTETTFTRYNLNIQIFLLMRTTFWDAGLALFKDVRLQFFCT